MKSEPPDLEEYEPTYQDVLDAPREKVAQIIDGKFYLMTRPAPKHAYAGSKLRGKLMPFDDDPEDGGIGGWIILFEPEMHFMTGKSLKSGQPGKNILVPDIAGWRRERMPSLPETAFFETVPDWVCEILSPSTAGIDRIKKMPIYHKQGVSHLWIIDPSPDVRSLEVLRHHESGYVQIASHSHDETVRAEPFDALPIKLKGLWG